MNILITGACGHIGSYLIEKINNIKKIKKVFLIDNFNSQRYQVLFNLKKRKIIFFLILILVKIIYQSLKKLIMFYI